MTCSCKCCCGCCCDGATGSQSLEPPCTSPKVFKGKGTICDVCCDLGEIREDITEEGECPGTWVTNGRCLENPCDVSGACCQCGGVMHPWDHASNEYLGPYYWETEAEANSAADDVVGFCEDLQTALAANGYCGATVNVVTPRVYQWTAFFFDPPQTVWSLVTDFASVTAGCCGTEEGELIGPKWPGTDFYPFGNISPCVDDGSNVTCTACSGCGDDPCCTFHAGADCGDDPCAGEAGPFSVKSVASGPGTELKKLLSKVGITTSPGCACNQRAKVMDQKGCDWCAENLPTITAWLKEEHARQKIMLPFSETAVSLLVRYAIRRARAIAK